MSYTLINSPLKLKIQDLPKKELKDYFQRFIDVIPQRGRELVNAVKQTPGFEGWQPDHSPTSLDMLGEWFAGQVETRQRTEKEIQEIKSRSPYPIDIPDEELTERTFSLAMDVGMYFSQVLLKSHPSLRWFQPLDDKRFVYYGQPVLVEFAPGPLSPVHIVETLGYGIAGKTKTGRRLREIYDYWSKAVRS